MNARSKAARRERPASSAIPYTAHVGESVVKTRHGDYVQVFRLAGASFETADDAQLNDWHERLNGLWRNIARENVALWTHVIRRREPLHLRNRHAPGFAHDLAAKYHARLAGETLMVNEIYLSRRLPPDGRRCGRCRLAILCAHAARGGTARARRLARGLREARRDAWLTALARYEPERLGVYQAAGRSYSSLLEFLGLLVNAEVSRVPLPRAPLAETLATTRPLFGFETIEYRGASSTRYGAMLGIVEYATPTTVGLLDTLLSTPYPWILTQSFAFLRKATAQSLLLRQFNRMQSAGDFALSQAEELKVALDELTSSEWVMGEHHLSLQVLTEPVAATDTANRERQLKLLNDQVANARTRLVDASGMTIAREDLALEAAFWAQLPGNFALRPRKAPITSRNFAALAAFHNYPAGRATGNHWGEALTLFATAAGTPYYFSYHASDPLDPEGGTKKDIGHTLIIGPTGSGKTALIAFTLCELQAFGVTSVLFTKDRDTEIVIRALGGRFYAIESGKSTGWNPFQLQPTEHNVAFLNDLVRRLVQRAGAPLTVAEEVGSHRGDRVGDELRSR